MFHVLSRLNWKWVILNIGFIESFSPEPPIQSPVSRNGFDTESDVYKMLQDYEEPVSEPKQSGSFKYLQGILEAEDGGMDSCVCIFVCLLIMCAKIRQKKACESSLTEPLNFIWRDHPLLLKILVDIFAPINFIVKVKSFYLAD